MIFFKTREIFVCIFILLLVFASLTLLPNRKSHVSTEVLSHNEVRVNELQLEMRKAQRRRLKSKIDHKPVTSRTPDVIIMGVRKCGTGPLRRFLKHHPSLVTADESHYYDRHSHRGIQFYKSLLGNATVDQLIVDKTPAYFHSLPLDLPSKIKHDCPGVKLILLLCEPARRSLSDFAQRVELSRNVKYWKFEEHMERYFPIVEDLPQTKHADLENLLFQIQKVPHLTPYAVGAYSFLLRRWMKAFSNDRLLLLDGELFLKDPGVVIETIQKFLSVPMIIKKEDFATNRETGLKCLRMWWNDFYTTDDADNKRFHSCTFATSKGRTRGRKSKYRMKNETEDKLKEFYRPFNIELKNMIKQNWDWLN